MYYNLKDACDKSGGGVSMMKQISIGSKESWNGIAEQGGDNCALGAY